MTSAACRAVSQQALGLVPLVAMDGADAERAEADQLAAAVERRIAHRILRGEFGPDLFDYLR